MPGSGSLNEARSPKDAGGHSEAADLLVYLNGSHVPQAQARISVFDSGLNFADGVFEGIRVYDGRVLHLEQHVARLYRSAEAFEIDVGMRPHELTHEILTWLRANNVFDGFHFRPIVTRGDRFPPRLDPRFCSGGSNIVFVGGPIAPASMRGARLITSSVRQINSDAIDPQIKSLNYGNNLLARLEALRRGVDDSLMLDADGHLAEASAANVFVVKDGAVLTPRDNACLVGITRHTVMELARARGIVVEERDLTPSGAAAADEIFLTGTGTELTPVVEIDGRAVGSGRVGQITKELYHGYREYVMTSQASTELKGADL